MVEVTPQQEAEIVALEQEATRLSDLCERAAKAYDGVWTLLGGDFEEERGLTIPERTHAQEAKARALRVLESVRGRVEAHRVKLKTACAAAGVPL